MGSLGRSRLKFINKSGRCSLSVLGSMQGMENEVWV